MSQTCVLQGISKEEEDKAKTTFSLVLLRCEYSASLIFLLLISSSSELPTFAHRSSLSDGSTNKTPLCVNVGAGTFPLHAQCTSFAVKATL